jgi:uncharacterized protein with PIN domain
VNPKRCLFRFYGNLNDFLPRGERARWIEYKLDGTVAVKHPIEALGVPHPEVETIVVDGVPVDFGHHLRDAEHVHVYPLWHVPCPPLRHRLRPPLKRPPRFDVDTHLGRLAAYLRTLGFDTLYRNDFEDAVLAAIAHDQQRVLLTRDRGLLKRKIVTYGFCVRQSEPRAQLVAAVRRYQLAGEVRPWSRCVHCNGVLRSVPKSDVLDRLEPKTKRYYHEFQQCDACGQIYWRGSHHEHMRRFLDGVLAEARPSGDAAPATMPSGS